LIGDAGSGEGFGGAPVFGSGVSVDGDVGEVVEELGGAVSFWSELEEAGEVVDELGVRVAGAESGIRDDVFEERNVGLHAADAEFRGREVFRLERRGFVSGRGRCR